MGERILEGEGQPDSTVVIQAEYARTERPAGTLVDYYEGTDPVNPSLTESMRIVLGDGAVRFEAGSGEKTVDLGGMALEEIAEVRAGVEASSDKFRKNFRASLAVGALPTILLCLYAVYRAGLLGLVVVPFVLVVVALLRALWHSDSNRVQVDFVTRNGRVASFLVTGDIGAALDKLAGGLADRGVGNLFDPEAVAAAAAPPEARYREIGCRAKTVRIILFLAGLAAVFALFWMAGGGGG